MPAKGMQLFVETGVNHDEVRIITGILSWFNIKNE
jgi:hypothetical protein